MESINTQGIAFCLRLVAVVHFSNIDLSSGRFGSTAARAHQSPTLKNNFNPTEGGDGKNSHPLPVNFTFYSFNSSRTAVKFPSISLNLINLD